MFSLKMCQNEDFSVYYINDLLKISKFAEKHIE